MPTVWSMLLRSLVFTFVFAGFAASGLGCAAEGSGPASIEGEALAQTKQKMVGGTLSSSAQDAAVMVGLAEGSCTGSLIAPNLVLTARHCVGNPAQTECPTFGATTTPSSIKIFLGVKANPDTGTPVARGKKITVPKTNNMCGFDVALVELDQDITDIKPSVVRFSALEIDEQTTAVGYGVGGNDEDRPGRMQRNTTVLGVGKTTLKYSCKKSGSLTFQLPNGDIATGESTCYGDSGGPLLDAQGRIVGVTSRGPDEVPEDGSHGNGCIDLPSIYASVRFNEATIRQAAEEAGHPLADGDGDEEEGDVAPQSDDEDDDDDKDDDEEDKPKKRTKRPVIQSSQCSATPGHTALASWMPLLGIGLGVAAVRRRRSRA